jgi:SAM-dependent methyltransferase
VPLVPLRDLAWDCATGNGQAARALARRFTRVIATDASTQQIALADPLPNVEYRVATAEQSGIATGSVQLVTVAQALHWLDLEAFYSEVRRVTVPGGVLAAWSYGSCHVDPDVDAIIRELEFGTLRDHWHPGRRWVDEGYRTIPFSFEEIPAPGFQLRVRWNLRQLGLYLESWSAVAAFRRDRGEDPVDRVLERLSHVWGPAEQARVVTWPLTLRAGRIE